MKTWIMLAVIAIVGVYFAVSDYQKRENEKIIKLEKMRLEAQERERREQEQIKERELKEQERKKQIDVLNTQLADLQQELSQLTAEAEKYDVKFAELNAEVDKNSADAMDADSAKSKIRNNERIMRGLNSDIVDFQQLDKDELIACLWECVPYDIFDKPRDTLTGDFLNCTCYSCEKHYRICRRRYHRYGNTYVCKKHKNYWTRSKFEKYKVLRERWRNLKNGYKNKVAKLRKYEKETIVLQNKLDEFRNSNSRSSAKIVSIKDEHRELLGKIELKKSQISRIERKIELLRK